MACRLFGDNPLSESVMVSWQSENDLKFISFHSRKMHTSAKMATILSRPQNVNWNEIGYIYGSPCESWMCLQPTIVMMTSPNGNIFRVTEPLWRESTGHWWIHSQRSTMRTFPVFFDLRLNKRLRKQPRSRWFQTPSRSLWRQCIVMMPGRQQAQW